MKLVFKVNPHQMTDGSGTVYGIDSPEGERIASTTDEYAARRLCTRLNSTLDDWAREVGADAALA